MRGRVVIEGDWQWIGADPPAVEERPLIEDGDVVPAQAPRAPTLGEALRAERERQGLGLDQIEAATRIRAAQLRAIEQDRLDALPAEAYARGFVREYAEQLAMDADAMVRLFNDQWNQRFGSDPEPAPLSRPPLAAAAEAARPLGVLSVVLALLLLVVSAAVFLTHQGSRSGPAAQPPPPSHASSGATSPPAGTAVAPPTAPASLHLTVRAAAGTCWVEARLGSATGRLLAERTLAQGETMRLRGRRIWIRLGDPASVRLRLNSRRLATAATADPINLLVSRNGARLV